MRPLPSRLVLLVACAGLALPAAAHAQASPSPRPIDSACQDAPPGGFADTRGNLFEREIDCVAWYGIAAGVVAGQYSPGATITRPQMAAFLVRFAHSAGVPPDTSDAGFTDLDGLSDEARDAVNAAANLGVAKGVAPGRFGAYEGVTRGQMATFLARLHRALTGQDLEPRGGCFDDLGGSAHEDAAERLCGTGIATGAAPRTFDPAPHVTRQQMAGFLARLLALEVEGGIISPPS